MSPSPSLLTFAGITKSFGAVRALRRVDFELRLGEVHALVGENGAGKSTLIKVATGAHRPDAGTITVGGETLSGLAPSDARRLGIACIYQQPALFPDLTVAENIALRLERPSLLKRIDWDARHQTAAEWLRHLKAEFPTTAEVRSLSMPEQQLVEIACAIGAGARIVIMDEPTASLTREEQVRLFAVVRDLRSRGIGVIYISHRLEEISALADRVTVLRDGETIATAEAAGASEAQLIQWMVGRDVEVAVRRVRPEPDAAIRLSAQNLGCAESGVSGVTFDVRAGEIFGLGGLVGAGRTELARILFGLTPADAGSIVIDGKNARPESPAHAIALGLAYLPEDRRRHGVVLEMSLTQNTSAAVLPRLFPSGFVRHAKEKSLADGYIAQLQTKASSAAVAAGTLSGGNQQKVALARWLATQPRVLILDEPTQGVDVGAKNEIHQIIARLAEEGIAVVLISSDLPELLALSSTIGVMRDRTLVGILPGGASASEVMALALGTEGGARR